MVAGLEIIKNQQPDNVPSLYFWMREARGALAEVDYILAKDMKILPIEVKAEVKGGMKSLYSLSKRKASRMLFVLRSKILDDSQRGIAS